ncbi:hypothetical protein O181_073077 [Austropuccinia psidii MF-1]|uniref:Uncharacterized protein n=1 Tax=Austropuccinia psidii MF-1 TaxID=1389203 RepID=A0A9Q3F8C7_9BASI|nr:hypothetical protein [Austropuccinia psidii MF-1]
MIGAVTAAEYSPSKSSQKGYRRDYSRSQSVSEGQGSVNELQTDKLSYSEADNIVSLQTELTPPQAASVDIYKAKQKACNNSLQYKGYQILVDLWQNFMKSYLTV